MIEVAFMGGCFVASMVDQQDAETTRDNRCALSPCPVNEAVVVWNACVAYCGMPVGTGRV